MSRIFFIASLVLVGCASTHDLAVGPSAWGGGVYREELQPGLYYIVVKSNVAPWTNHATVSAQWQAEADRLCGSAGYHALRTEVLVEEAMEPMQLLFVTLPYLVTVRLGYALCASAGMSIESAEQYLKSRP